MTQFKPGDRVRVLEGFYPMLRAGDEFTVESVEGDIIRVKHSNGINGWYASRFEKVEPVRTFKAGDRIRTKDGSTYNGKTEATVVDAPGGENCGDYPGEEKVWADWWGTPSYISADRVELVSEKEVDLALIAEANHMAESLVNLGWGRVADIIRRLVKAVQEEA